MDTMLRKALRKYNGLRQQLDNVLLGDEGDVWEAELKNFLAKRPCWNGSRGTQVASSAESLLDFIIRVDRSVRPAYPDGVKEVIHPELECTGPAEYDLQTEVEQWLHDKQKSSRVTGQVIYDHLKASGELALHLGLADLMAVQQKGIAVFRALYAGKTIFGWKSVVRYRYGHLHVPYLYEHSLVKVILNWRWLDSGWLSDDPALRFRK